MELSVRKKYNVNIVAIKSNNGGKVNISPEPEYKFKDTDSVVLVEMCIRDRCCCVGAY